MTTFLIILLVLAMIATVVALVRGIIAFLKTTEAQLKGEAEGKEAMLKQNNMMVKRIVFQGLAVLVIMLLLLLNRG